MAEHFRFSFPQPPFGYLIQRMFNEDAFVSDVSRLAAITADQRAHIADQLEHQTFADIATLKSAVEAAQVPEADDVANTLHRLSSMFRESETSKEAAYRAFTSAIASSKVARENIEAIQETFHALCLQPHSLDLQQKAERLSSATGCSVEDLDIVCDIRPVFNVGSDRIVGAIPYFTLRIEYDDGEAHKIDLHLSNENIDRLKKVVDRATSKREVLQQAIAAMPDWSEPRIQKP